jgi:hypothetical protein
MDPTRGLLSAALMERGGLQIGSSACRRTITSHDGSILSNHVALAPGVEVSGHLRPQRLLHWVRPGDHARKLGIIHLRAEGAPHVHALLQLDQGADRTGRGPLADSLILC